MHAISPSRGWITKVGILIGMNATGKKEDIKKCSAHSSISFIGQNLPLRLLPLRFQLNQLNQIPIYAWQTDFLSMKIAYIFLHKNQLFLITISTAGNKVKPL